MLHVANMTTSSVNVFIFLMLIIFFAMTIEQKKNRDINIAKKQIHERDQITKENEINVQATTMKRMLKKKEISTISIISHSSSQKTLVK